MSHHHGRKVSLKNNKDVYITAEQDGTVSCKAEKVQDWERWTMREVGGGKATFESYHGKFLTMDDKKNHGKSRQSR